MFVSVCQPKGSMSQSLVCLTTDDWCFDWQTIINYSINLKFAEVLRVFPGSPQGRTSPHSAIYLNPNLIILGGHNSKKAEYHCHVWSKYLVKSAMLVIMMLNMHTYVWKLIRRLPTLSKLKNLTWGLLIEAVQMATLSSELLDLMDLSLFPDDCNRANFYPYSKSPLFIITSSMSFVKVILRLSMMVNFTAQSCRPVHE